MPVNPNEFKKDRLLLFYGDGMWDQAEVGDEYTAWDSEAKENVSVKVVRV